MTTSMSLSILFFFSPLTHFASAETSVHGSNSGYDPHRSGFMYTWRLFGGRWPVPK